MAILTRDGNIVDVNASFLGFVGFSKDDLTGRDCRETELLGRLWNNIAAAMFGKSEKNERILVGAKTFDVFITPISTGSDITHVSVLFRDISALVDLERDFTKKSREIIITNTVTVAAPQKTENKLSLYATVPNGRKVNSFPRRKANGNPVVCPTASSVTWI